MTALEAIAVNAAKDQYDRARREHQRVLREGTRQPLSHTFAYRRLVRYAPSETIVVRELLEQDHQDREGYWP